MRKLVGIFFALALALVTAQVFAFADTAIAPQKKSCCDCGRAKCCAAKSDSASKDVPVVPAPSSNQKSFQIASPLAAWTLTTLNVSDAQVAAANFTSPVVRVVPLFTRDCAYLL
ncbi:MAG TPA: hypothetical protein VF437_10585 [Verrucomicrobiae bacterium]